MILKPTTSGVRVRSGQGTTFAIVMTLSPTQTVEAHECYREFIGTQYWIAVQVGALRGFVRGDLLKEVAALAWPYARPLAGVQGPSNPSMDHWTEQVYADIKRSRLPAVKILANADVDGSVVTRLKTDGVQAVVVRILNTIDASKAKSGRDYCEEVIEPTLRLYQAGARHFEVGNEPNLGGPHLEGMWVFNEITRAGWRNGREHKVWFEQAVNYLRPLMPLAYFGYPAVSPGPAIPGERADGVQFLREVNEAGGYALADFICQHVYWNNIDSSALYAAQEVKRFAATYPTKPLMLTEFSNVNADTPKEMKGLEYVTFYTELKRLAIPNLLASFCYTLSWDADAHNEGWLGSPIPDIVGQNIRFFS